MSMGRKVVSHLMDIHWTGGLDRAVGQAWTVRVGCPMDIPLTSIGHVNCMDRTVGKAWSVRVRMSNGHPMEINWIGGLDRIVGRPVARTFRRGV